MQPALKLQWSRLVRKAIILELYYIIINKIFCEYRQGAPSSHQNGCGQKTLTREHKLKLTPKGQNTDFQSGETKHKQGTEA